MADNYCAKSMIFGIGTSLAGLALMTIAIFISGHNYHDDPYGKALPLTGIVLTMVGLLFPVSWSWCRKYKNCCRSNNKETDDTFGSHSEQLHSRDNSARYLRNGSRLLPVSQDGAQPSEIPDSNGVIPVSSATLERPLPVGTLVQETISSSMNQPTFQVIQRSHSDRNRIPIPMENLNTDLDHMFVDLRPDDENSGVLFPTLKREALPPPCYQEVMEHPVENLSTDLDHIFVDLRRDGENTGALFPTPRRDSPPPPSYQEVIEGGYVELPQTYQQRSAVNNYSSDMKSH